MVQARIHKVKGRSSLQASSKYVINLPSSISKETDFKNGSRPRKIYKFSRTPKDPLSAIMESQLLSLQPYSALQRGNLCNHLPNKTLFWIKKYYPKPTFWEELAITFQFNKRSLFLFSDIPQESLIFSRRENIGLTSQKYNQDCVPFAEFSRRLKGRELL